MAGVIGTVAFAYRYQPAVQEMRAQMLRGELGLFTSVQGVFMQDWLLSAPADEWRMDPTRGGTSRAFADIGSHLVDLIEFVTGDHIMSLTTKVKQVVGGPETPVVHADDVIAAVIETTTGAIGSLMISQVAPGHGNSLSLELNGTERSLRLNLSHPMTLESGPVGSTFSPEPLTHGIARVGFTPHGDMSDFVGAFSALVDDSYALMSGDTRDGVPTLLDGLRAVNLCEAAIHSAASNSTTTIRRR